ncbi:hypothetical protein AVEN_263564-1 [Araneus ventricosus]|uniref:RNase H type-1 domain-containing protein n=1 Tax=Araneus ventricosus TaxID=182803 RepID=A0A4Y2HTT4_ARAVE|nr:hypothetical protein AVEN_263564-1 [Araneus ventricosus]
MIENWFAYTGRLSSAGIKGYDSVVYFQNTTTLETSFAISKSRVAPLGQLKLLRVELMTATIAAMVADYLQRFFKIRECNIYCFSDSQIVLHWLRGSANKWKPFVANRVRDIENLIAPSQWQFCKGT